MDLQTRDAVRKAVKQAYIKARRAGATILRAHMIATNTAALLGRTEDAEVFATAAQTEIEGEDTHE